MSKKMDMSVRVHVSSMMYGKQDAIDEAVSSVSSSFRSTLRYVMEEEGTEKRELAQSALQTVAQVVDGLYEASSASPNIGDAYANVLEPIREMLENFKNVFEVGAELDAYVEGKRDAERMKEIVRQMAEEDEQSSPTETSVEEFNEMSIIECNELAKHRCPDDTDIGDRPVE